MWEVVWTDPDRESRKEHRERKAVEKEQKDKKRTSRHSKSTRDSASSASLSSNILGKDYLKAAKRGKSRLTASTTSMTSNDEGKNRPFSTVSKTESTTGLSTGPTQPAAGLTDAKIRNSVIERFSDSIHDSPGSSTRDSVFSKWTESSALAPSSPCNTSLGDTTSKSTQYVQVLGPSSFIVQSTDVTVELRKNYDESVSTLSEIKISANSKRQQPPTPPQSPQDTVQNVSKHLAENDALSPPMLNGQVVCATPCRLAFNPNNLDAWKPPDDWDCQVPLERRNSKFENIVEEVDQSEIKQREVFSTANGQHEIARMASASNATRLSRLKEAWGRSDDGTIYKELEMERKRWMLTSLEHMDKPIGPKSPVISPTKRAAAEANRILALFESQATASYLALVHRSKTIYHLSPSPLGHELSPNVRPILVPGISVECICNDKGLFGAVYCLSLPAIVSSPEIPDLLKNVHGCLASKGILHFALIDPQPLASTIGPRLRAWLDKHLMSNLERKNRCPNPSKQFPTWLADASLRGEGSTITSAKFLAVSPQRPAESASNAPQPTGKIVKSELRTLVGRMLWKEAWSQFVEADSWWWEDPNIEKECRELRTVWEYSRIEAVKCF